MFDSLVGRCQVELSGAARITNELTETERITTDEQRHVAAIRQSQRGDIAYMLVIIWAFVGIAVKHSTVPIVATGAWVAAAMVGLMTVVGIIVRLR